MLRTVLRDLVAHRARVAMTLVAIALGVAATVASWAAADSSVTTLVGQATREGVGVAVQSSEAPTLTGDDLHRLAALDGVTGATGIRTGRAGLVGQDGKLVPSTTLLDRAGSSWDGTGRFPLVAGTAPRHPGEIAIGTDAAQGGLRPGDEVRVLLSDARSATARITGVFDYVPLGPDDGEITDPRPAVAFAAQDAAGLLGPHYLRVELAVAPGHDPTAVRDAARRLMGEGPAVATGDELAAAAVAEAREDGTDILITLLPFAAVALLVGVFIIANTFTMLVTQRTRQFALLRAIGARRGQVRRAVLAEAAVLGVVGGTLGVLAGLPLAPAMLLVMGGQDVAFAVSPTAVLLGYAVAIAVTMLAASGAARRAATVPPMAALRMDAVVPQEVLRTRTLVGLGLIAVALAGVIATAEPSAANLPRIVGLVSAVLAVVGVLVLAPRLAVLVFGPLTRLIDRPGRPAIRLAVRNVARDPRRTAGTAAAITIGLGLVCAFATLSATFAGLISSTTRANVPLTTTVVQPAAGGDATLSEADLRIVAGLPGVTAVAGSRDRIVDITVPSGPTVRRISAIEPDALGTVLTPQLTAGTADLGRGVVVSQNQADMLGLRLGDPITLAPGGVPVRTSVVGVYDATELGASIYYDVALAPPAVRDAISMIYATGPDPAVEAAFAQRPDVRVTDREGLVAQGVAEQRAAFVLMYAMFGLAILIAVFGVVNTLALSVRERTREIGVLRAVGAPRSLVQRTVRAESIAIALFGAVLGVLMGVFVGAVMQHAMLGQQLWDAVVPFGTIALCLVGIVVVAVLAAVWPARTAAHTDMLAAIAAP